MSTEEVKKELKKLLRDDLNTEAKEKYGIADSAEYPNADELIDAVIAKIKKESPSKPKAPKKEEKKSAQKEVSAEIETVKRKKNGAELTLKGKKKAVEVNENFARKYQPRAGGIYKRSKDGVESYKAK